MNKHAARKFLRHNQRVHDAVASRYAGIHHEIFNPTEQRRLALALHEALSHLATPAQSLTILDLGAGTGNVTAHLIDTGAQVVAADVSKNCLQFVMAKFKANSRLQTFLLNGSDLSGLADNRFDMVATYSVLHHIPDYLGTVSEMVRTTKPGGLIFIDHELCPSFWPGNSPEYEDYQKQIQCLYRVPPGMRLQKRIMNCFSLNAWRRLINKHLFGLNPEGDIHVYKHDHIEWAQIHHLLEKACVLVKSEDYLLCKEPTEPAPIYEYFKTRCFDMRYVIYRKRS